jgi:acetyl esterase/lipase
MKRFHTLLVLAVVLLAAHAHSAQADKISPTLSDQPYGDSGDPQQVLDLYMPSGTASIVPRPVVLYIHGGAWNSGSENEIPEVCLEMLRKGIAIASVRYRLTGPQGECAATPASWSPIPFPAQIHDVKAAVRWLKVHGDDPPYDLDVDRIGVHGNSAGAQLALLLAVTGDDSSLDGTVGSEDDADSSIAIVSAYAAPTDFYAIAEDDLKQAGGLDPPCTSWDDCCSALSAYFGWKDGLGDIKAHWSAPSGPYVALKQLVIAASPISWLNGTSKFPPMFLAHGTIDETVSTIQANRFSTRLHIFGIPHDYRPLPEVPHRFTEENSGYTDEALIEFYLDFFAPLTPPPVSFTAPEQSCFGYNRAPDWCPCGNESHFRSRQGCKWGQVSQGMTEAMVGAELYATGIPSVSIASAHQLVLHADGMTNGLATFWQASAQSAPTFFAEGLDCLSGTRLVITEKDATNGFARYPTPGDTPLSLAGGIHPTGQTVYYQVRYRTQFGLCGPIAFNTTNSVKVSWVP